MTLRNMGDNGARSLAITCGAIWCNHEAVLDVNFFSKIAITPLPISRRLLTGSRI
jgi:hypothetical protein